MSKTILAIKIQKQLMLEKVDSEIKMLQDKQQEINDALLELQNKLDYKDLNSLAIIPELEISRMNFSIHIHQTMDAHRLTQKQLAQDISRLEQHELFLNFNGIMVRIIKAKEIHQPSPVIEEPADCRDIEKELEEAYKRGFLDGQKKSQTVELNIQTTIEQALNQITDNIPQQISRLRASLCEDVAQVISSVIEHVLLQQPPNHQILTRHINTMLNQIDKHQSVELSLNHDDLALLKKHHERLDIQAFAKVNIIADEHIRRGECRIKTSEGVFEHSLEQRLDAFSTWLKQVSIGALDVST